MAAAAPFAQIGMAIGVLLKTKDKDLRTLAASGIVPGALAGTTELITYGILVKYKRTMAYSSSGRSYWRSNQWYAWIENDVICSS